MNRWFGVSVLSRSAVLWCFYGITLLVSTIGLAVLSMHALQLSRKQQETTWRTGLEQNIRTALWRMDSRIGPLLATMHQSNVLSPEYHCFVRTRFRVLPGGSKGEPSGELAFQYDPAAVVGDLQADVPIAQLTSAVNETIPFFPFNNDRAALVQQAMPQVYSPRDQRMRNSVVQSNVGNAYDNFPKQPQRGLALAPIWVGDQLVLVRRFAGAIDFEGVWLNWDVMKESLLDDIGDLVPDADLRPIQSDVNLDSSRALAALPAELISDSVGPTPSQWSATHTSLSIAWLALLAAGCIAAAALHRLIALSERRAMFVSAVTHELRTPLTTFRLYSDLLSRDMVQDPQDRKEYLATLRREADRLTHLVDNVLRYSKLERSTKRPVLEPIELEGWIARIKPRLSDRLATAGLELVVELPSDLPDDALRWETDPAAMEQLLFNLVDNASKYAKPDSDRRVQLRAQVEGDVISFCVIDHGCGVPADLRRTIFKPFTKSVQRAAETAAGVGLGLALARQTAGALGGSLEYRETPGGGATFCVRLPR